MTIRVTKELNFCAAHRLLGYNGPCKNIHGHNYRVLITLERPQLSPTDNGLDKLGFVIDFKSIKRLIQTWIDDKLDHALLINKEDKTLLNFAKGSSMKHFVMPVNATAEHLASMILMYARGIFAETKQQDPFNDEVKVIVSRVIVYETDSSRAEAQ